MSRDSHDVPARCRADPTVPSPVPIRCSRGHKTPGRPGGWSPRPAGWYPTFCLLCRLLPVAGAGRLAGEECLDVPEGQLVLGPRHVLAVVAPHQETAARRTEHSGVAPE